ncbi:hypothetical protein [Arthrobacter glacialis]|uniref:hypothetical protein n=1 Tax=Arthrobacter glacialis TaxID=1664 RepID=UPI0010575053|nr:hypothetical protein [Arthrobacter glacialis]
MRYKTSLLVSSATLVGLLFSGAPAMAQSPSELEPLEVLESAGLYSTPSFAATSKGMQAQSDPSGDSVSSESNSTVNTVATDAGLNLVDELGATQLTMSPVIKGAPVVEGGAATYKTDQGYSMVLTDSTAGLSAGYSIITSADAPSNYSYSFDVDGSPANLSALEDGSILVSDKDGNPSSLVAPAWAKDANGTYLETKYEIEGNVLTQTVNLDGAAFPVIADPRLQQNLAFSTIEFTRSETNTASSSTGGFIAICGGATAVFAPIGAVCGVLAGASIIVATQAKNTGKCLGIRIGNWGTAPFPVIVNCYA